MTAIPQAQSKFIDQCIKYLATEYEFIYGEKNRKYVDLFNLIATQTLEAIANCDAPYHNLEHTLQEVTRVICRV
jgi:hypothetical protein